MSFIRQFIDRCYGRTTSSCRLTFAGLDYSGKTTLLYLLKSYEVIQAHGTLGFNVEDFTAPTMSNKAGNIITGWDVGARCGLQYLLGLLAIYFKLGDAVVWVVDSADKERFSESAESLQTILGILEKEEPKPMPILVLAHKQDLPNARSADEVRLAFSKALSGKISAVFPTTSMRSLGPESGLPQAFDWLKVALSIASSNETHLPQTVATQEPKEIPLPHQINVRSPGNLAQKLNTWLGRTESDSPPDEFLSQFDNIALPEWDHYTHIRLAFLTLSLHGRQKGKDMIFKGIERYISESKGLQTTGRTFHVTMTYFWIQIVHFGIQNTPPRSASEIDTNEDFARFLIINPYVVDGQLWMDYYSKDKMMGQDARVGMVLPDKKALPSIAIRDHINKLATSA